MGLLTCARCGCAITAEPKKGKYVYYHCTNFRGDCDNTYVREERLADLFGDVINWTAGMKIFSRVGFQTHSGPENPKRGNSN